MILVKEQFPAIFSIQLEILQFENGGINILNGILLLNNKEVSRIKVPRHISDKGKESAIEYVSSEFFSKYEERW